MSIFANHISIYPKMKKLLYIFATIFICITSCDRTDKPITLSVDKKEIIADDEDFATFKVLCEGKDVTEESRIILKDGNVELGTALFSTSEAKSYTFFAKRKSHDSNEVTITAKNPEPENPEDPDEPDNPENPEEPQLEGPIFLTASTDTIVANGIDVVSFTAIQDSVDVTSSVKFFVNDNIIESNVFSTESSGNYIVYAKKNDTIISNEISFFAKEYVEPEIPIVIAASTDTIVADGIDAIIFTVTEGKRNITNNIDIYVNGNKIEGNKFTTTVAGEYSAYAKRGDVTSNEISFFAKEVEEPEEPEKPIELFASKTNIIADGIDAVTFTVKQDNIDVTSEVEIFINGNKIDGNSFTTTTAGNYNVNAKKGELVSNELNIIAEEYIEPEKPIELSASTTSITANGIDVISFTVIQDGDNVTNQSEIYVNNSLISGNQFSTFTPGTYTAYAKKNEVVSNEISFTAEAGSNTGTTIVFAEGVTINSGWYDVNKVGMGDNGDINMCWAASCSNIIQWWQDRYVAAGNTLPVEAISGPGAGNSEYELALMDMFHDQWDNTRGADVAHGITWYFEGRNIRKEMSPGSYAQPLEEYDGGYFEDVWNDILPHVYHEYDYIVVPGILEYNDLISNQYSNYDYWGNGSGLHGNDRLKKFSELVVEFMNRGMISLTIALNSNLGSLSHATTLWGYEIDNETGILTKIWITDSDDMATEPKIPVLHEYTVGLNDVYETIEFTGSPYGKCYAVSLYPVSGYGSR